MRVTDIGGCTHSPQLRGAAPPLVETSHEKHAGVDDSPGQIAAKRAEEHGPNLDCVCGHDAERQSEGKRHYQAEQDLRDPVHRFQDSIRRFGRKLRHGSTAIWTVHFPSLSGPMRARPFCLVRDFPVSL
jgi:hypothetical protein